MSDRNKIHVGITGNQAIVGKGLGAYAGNPAERAAVERGLNKMMTPAQVSEARQKQIAATARLNDAAVPKQATGEVNVTVNSNGTKADAKTKTDGTLFQSPAVTQHRQMQPTTNAANTGLDIAD
jgi:hypothetical protein